MQTETPKKLFTVDDYHRMAEVGILHPGERTELINGEVVHKESMNPPHRSMVSRATQILVARFAGRAEVAVQLPVQLNRYSQPEPDISLLFPRKDFYKSRHPGPDDVLLVFEIAHTTLEFDRSVKLEMYAKAGIREVWIADVAGGSITVFRNPTGKAYSAQARLDRHDTISMLAFPETVIAVSDLIGE